MAAPVAADGMGTLSVQTNPAVCRSMSTDSRGCHAAHLVVAWTPHAEDREKRNVRSMPTTITGGWSGIANDRTASCLIPAR